MKTALKILIHPITICLLFCFLIISGESTGFFYIFLLLLGLPHGVLHSMLGIAGIGLLLSSIAMKESNRLYIIRLAGALCLILSLVRFFTQPGASYNYNTLRASVPLSLLIIFSLLLLLFMLNQVYMLVSKRKPPISVL
jgi:hypothetical protein